MESSHIPPTKRKRIHVPTGINHTMDVSSASTESALVQNANSISADISNAKLKLIHIQNQLRYNVLMRTTQ